MHVCKSCNASLLPASKPVVVLVPSPKQKSHKKTPAVAIVRAPSQLDAAAVASSSSAVATNEDDEAQRRGSIGARVRHARTNTLDKVRLSLFMK